MSSTGYPKGRPRNGEFRPDNAKAAYQREYMKNRRETDTEFREHLRQKQAKWRAANLERAQQLSRETYARQKAWERAYAIGTPIQGQFPKMK